MRMKQVFISASLLSVLITSYSFAQMGHGMMREHGGGQGMMEHMMMHEGVMDREQTAESMTDITRQISELLRDLSGKIENVQPDKLHDLRDIMKDTSDEMHNISGIIEKGTATVEEINAVRERIAVIKQRIEDMSKVQERR